MSHFAKSETLLALAKLEAGGMTITAHQRGAMGTFLSRIPARETFPVPSSASTP